MSMLDTVSNAMATPRPPSDMRHHVLSKMMHPKAITKTDGGYRVNDLNPSNGIQNFGVSQTHGEALKHLRAIEYFKHGGTR